MARQPPRPLNIMEDDSAKFCLRKEEDFDECEVSFTVLKDKLLPARIRSYRDK